MARKRATTSTPPQPPAFRSRITEHLIVPADEIVFAPLNPRRHPAEQTAAVTSSLRRLGWLDEVKVWRRPDGRLQLIDGEDRTRIAMREPGQHVPVAVLDLSEAEAEDALATYDASTYMALYDADRTRELAFRVEAHDRDAATLLRIVAERDVARDLLERWREETGEGDTYNGAGANGDDDSDWQGEGDGQDGVPEDDEEDDNSDTIFRDGETHTKIPSGIFDEDTVLDAAVAHYRATGFPYRKLPVYVSMQRLNRLAATPLETLLRTSVGGDVADTYHPHRFHGHVDTWLSPYEAFQDDKLLRHALKLRYEDAGTLKEGYPTTLNLVNHTRACFNFRPGFAAYLYKTYCKPGDVVLDTSTGYGGRLVGFLASGIAHTDTDQSTGRYIGIDPNTETWRGNERMAAELGFAHAVELIHAPAEDVPHEALAGRCDFAFTSPPYVSKEKYSDEETQSWKRYRTPQAWRNGFLRPMLRLQYAALKPGAYSLLNVDDVTLPGGAHAETIPLVDWTRDDALLAGLEYVETRYFDLAVSFGLGHDAQREHEREAVLVFRKPLTAVTHDGTPQSVSTSTQALPEPATLAQWMSKLYRVSADEGTLRGDLGIWPEELGDYLERLCLCYSPQQATYTLAPGLLLITPSEADAPAKPYRPETCVVLYSGGKDSMAAGVLAQHDHGYQHIHAVHIKRVNHSYPQEADYAERSARALGWDYTAITPEYIPSTRGESVVKNQYCVAVALEMLPFVPGAVTTGSYHYEDCHTTSWYSDMQAAYASFLPALDAATGRRTQLLTVLEDERQAVEVWRTRISESVRQETCSCLMPLRNKPQHRRRVLASGVPLLPYDCGTCEKCYARALILASLDIEDDATAYPARYLKQATKRLSSAFAGALWSHAHPALEATDFPTGASAERLMAHVFGGMLTTSPRKNEAPAIAPRVLRWTRNDGEDEMVEGIAS